MPTTLMKTCLFGMAGVMTIGLAACGGNSSSTDTSASATSGRASAAAVIRLSKVERVMRLMCVGASR